MKKIIIVLACMSMTFIVLAQGSYTTSSDNYFNLIQYVSDVNFNIGNANYYNERGLLKERENDLEGALEYYAKAVNIASQTPAYLFNYGITLQKLERHKEAVEVLFELTELDNIDFEAFVALGTSYGMLGEYRKAVEAYNAAERLRPSYGRMYYQRGIFLNLDGDYVQAQKDFDKAIKREPNFAKAWYNRGVNFKDMERFRRAIRDLDKAIALDPDYGLAYMVRGVSYINLGKTKEGAADLKRAAEMGIEEAQELYEKYGRDEVN